MSDLGPSSTPPGYYTAVIPKELTSRGSGDLVPIEDLTPFDVMPQLIGSTYLTMGPGWREGIHRYGEQDWGPFLSKQLAYKDLAEEALEGRGNLYFGLEHYRRGLYWSLQFTAGVASFGGEDGRGILLGSAEVDAMRFSEFWGAVEGKLYDIIWAGEVAFDPDEYKDFVNTFRAREKRLPELVDMFGFAKRGIPYPLGGGAVLDPTEVGEELIELCVAMGRPSSAIYVAEELGRVADVTKLTELVGRQRKEHAGIGRAIQRHLPNGGL